ncbi:helix-turn-helix domain-containing protein [Streptomyces sp. NPDC059708]|uniref:helix-turn-helix domain-containing protein n=1 Tax=Streptomyces sp. NPDC059708 TaxID=3346916 RepID=UPI0036AAE609
MTTTHRLLPRQAALPAPAQGPRRRWDLPEPEERRRLREQWGLSTRQVAAAFGVTPATVRSWERGRSAPRGGRKEAYRRFLSGLAQHAGAAEAPAHGTRAATSAAPVPRAHRRRGAAVEPAPAAPAVPDGAVRRHDPVSPERIRRLRLLGAAACVWSLAWWVALTCPPPL